jgi:nicotinate-nucleotide adenylyltransferase
MEDVKFEQFHTIAILGGTFNPVHAGHVTIAQAILRTRPEVEQLVCMPNHIPAYKEKAAIVDGSMRLDMLRLAMNQLPKVSVSDFELKRDGYTYTVDTFTRLKQLYPKLTIEFVIGDDSLFQLHKWYEFERLAELCEILVVARGGQRDMVEAYIRTFCTKYPTFRISYVEMPQVPVSSSEVRARIAKGESVQGLVPDKVLRYIETHALYKQEAGRR